MQGEILQKQNFDARDPLLVWIPAPSTHSADPSAALRALAKSGQALLRTGFARMTVFNRFLNSPVRPIRLPLRLRSGLRLIQGKLLFAQG